MDLRGIQFTLRWRLGTALAVLMLLLLMSGSRVSAAPAKVQTTFETPEAAAEVLRTALRNNDEGTLPTCSA